MKSMTAVIDKNALIKAARQELCKRDFWEYCKYMTPSFFKEERGYLKDIAHRLQDFMESPRAGVLLLNVPRRHGKTYITTHFAHWLLGTRGCDFKVAIASYNVETSTRFSERVRNAILSDSFQSVFPDVTLQYGSASKKQWKLEGATMENYMATAPGSAVTGSGFDLIMIDDIVADATSARNMRELEDIWFWYNNSLISTAEGNEKIIVVMTRWANADLTGKLLEHAEESGYEIEHIVYQAYQGDINDENATALCEDVFSMEKLRRLHRSQESDIFMANYQQVTFDIQGSLYKQFKTYTHQEDYKRIEAYADIADRGADYLALIIYGVTLDDEVHVLDVYYTDKDAPETEPVVTELLDYHQVQRAVFEANGGGIYYQRNVDRRLKERGNRFTVTVPHNQTKNKIVRIEGHAAWILENVYFPRDYRTRWARFAEALHSYQRGTRNAHDDAPDALTGVAEMVIESAKMTPFKVKNPRTRRALSKRTSNL